MPGSNLPRNCDDAHTRMLSLRQCCHSDSDVPGKWNVPLEPSMRHLREVMLTPSKDTSLEGQVLKAGVKKNRAGGRVIFSPQICAVNLEPLVNRERCTCGTKIARGDNAHRQKKMNNPCCDSSRICDLQQIAFVSSHKIASLLNLKQQQQIATDDITTNRYL